MAKLLKTSIKKINVIIVPVVLLFQFSLFAQTPDLTELIKQTQIISERTDFSGVV